MKLNTKILGGVVAAFVTLAVVLILVANWMVSRILSPGFIAGKIEETIDVRAHLGEVSSSVFSPTASVEIRDFALASKDAPGFTDAPIKLGKVRAAVSLVALLDKRLSISAILLQDADLKVTLYADGSNSINRMLNLPGPSSPAESAPPPVPKPAFNARTLPAAVSLSDIRLQNINVDLTVEKNGALVRLRDFNLALDRIGINPQNLAEFNNAELQLDGAVTLDSARDKQLRYADLSFSGPMLVKPFDVDTGNIDANVTTWLEISPTAYLSPQIPSVQKAFTLMDKLRQFGLDYDPIPEQVTFLSGRKVEVNYYRGKLTFNNAFTMLLGDWQLDIAENSWLNVADGTHSLATTLTASAALSKKFRGQLNSGLTKVPEEIRSPITRVFEDHWFKNERLVGTVRMSGELASPGVMLETPLPDYQKALLDEGKERASELIKEKAGEKTEGLIQRLINR